MPFRREAANLSRMRSPMTSLSNCAKLSRILSVSRPIDVVVLNCWVMLTNEALFFSNTSTIFAKSGERATEPVDLVDNDDFDATALDIAQQPLQRGAVHGTAGEAAIVVAVADNDPALVLLALDVSQRRLALSIEGIELHIEPLVGRDAGVDGAADLAYRGLHLALR